MKSREEIEEACKNSSSMRIAAKSCGMKYTTFIRYAKLYGCFISNQGGRGYRKVKKNLKDVFSGEVGMCSDNLRYRLVKEGYFEYICSECGINEWMGKPLSLELDHIDGNNKNNSLENLRILCPNCHSQTPTFRSRNKNKK